MSNPLKLKTFFLFFLATQLFLSYANLAYATTTPDTSQPAYTGVADQLKTYLCTPTDTGNNNVGSAPIIGTGNAQLNNTAGADLFNCINKVYRFAIAFGAAIGIGFIVVAGYVYMSAEGNQESVDKAKSIFTSTITSMVILFAGYVLLRAINPDLLQFHNVQPPTVTTPLGGIGGSTVVTGSGVPAGCTTTRCVFQGYDIGPYATALLHEQTVISFYNDLSGADLSSADAITAYMGSKSKSPPDTIPTLLSGQKDPLTGQMIMVSAQRANVDLKLMLALMRNDSRFGTDGLGAKTHNPGNVGNNGVSQKDWQTWDAGVDAVAQWLANHRAS